jgi:hypothetical protein
MQCSNLEVVIEYIKVGFAWVELDQFDFLEKIRWVKSKSRRVRSNYIGFFYILKFSIRL